MSDSYEIVVNVFAEVKLCRDRFWFLNVTLWPAPWRIY